MLTKNFVKLVESCLPRAKKLGDTLPIFLLHNYLSAYDMLKKEFSKLPVRGYPEGIGPHNSLGTIVSEKFHNDDDEFIQFLYYIAESKDLPLLPNGGLDVLTAYQSSKEGKTITPTISGEPECRCGRYMLRWGIHDDTNCKWMAWKNQKKSNPSKQTSPVINKCSLCDDTEIYEYNKDKTRYEACISDKHATCPQCGQMLFIDSIVKLVHVKNNGSTAQVYPQKRCSSCKYSKTVTVYRLGEP